MIAVWFVFLTLVTGICLWSQLKTDMHGRLIVDKNANKFIAGIACLLLILISGLRSLEGIGDTETYVGAFHNIPKDYETFKTIINYDGEWGFEWLQFIIKKITENPQYYLMIMSVLILIPIFYMFFKYSDSLAFAVFVFITGGNFLVTMNGMRQYLVSSLLFVTFPLIYKKKWWIYFPIVLLLSTIHKSCLIFLLVYFIADKRAWGVTSKILIAGGMILYFVKPLSQRISLWLLEGSQYEVYGKGIQAGSNGSNIFRSLIYLVPIVLAYFYHRRIKEEHKYYNIVFNISLLNCIFSFLSNSVSWIFARFNIYFSLYSILLLCWGIRSIPNKNRERSLVYFMAYTLYFIFYFYEMVVVLGQTYRSSYF